MISAAAIEKSSIFFKKVFPAKTLSSVLLNYDDSKSLLEESGVRETVERYKSLLDRKPTQRQLDAKDALEEWRKRKAAVETNKSFETYAKYRPISSYIE